MADVASSLVVLRGEHMVHRADNHVDDRDLFYTFSVSKPVVAMAVHLLAERGELQLDDPVSRYWPAYAEHGKGAITIRQVLTHRAGVPTSTRSTMKDVRIAADWDASVHAAATARPRYRPGDRVHYHSLSFGFILGELVRRVSGVDLPGLIRDEFFAPLGMNSSFIQLPGEHLERAIPLVSVGPLERIRRDIFNGPAMRRALTPAASLHTTAADLAAFYRMLLRCGVTASGRRLVAEQTVAAATAISSDGEFDAGMLHTARWGTGFQLGFPGKVRVHGTLAASDTFGHNGSNICNVWADPRRDLVFVYLSNLTQKRLRARRVLSALSDRTFERYGGAG